MQQQNFINSIAQGVMDECKGTGLFPSVMIAQACLESAYGQSGLSLKAHNYFGMKTGSNWKGKKVIMDTAEYVNGKRIIIPQAFRAYDSLEENFKDHIAMLERVGVYKKAGVFNAKTAAEQCDDLLKAGYATDPKYPQKLKAIITEYNLTQFDNH